MKKIRFIVDSILDIFSVGFNRICLFFSKGMFFYFYIVFSFLSKIFKFKFINRLRDFFKKLQNTPDSFMTVAAFCLLAFFFYNNIYISKNTVFVPENNITKDKIEYKEIIDDDTTTNNNNSEDINLFRKFSSKYNINNIDFNELKSINDDVVAWITVDSTNINYPVVLTSDNDYYLEHDINKSYTTNGWTFMDYRNSPDMSDKNTIFYGHNLLNKTAFGSLSNLFTDKWFKNSNHKINVRTENGFYTYQVFSVYYIDPEVYYLQTSFYNDERYKDFLNTLVSRSLYDFNEVVGVEDKIITLSTCTEDNKNRKVIHAKRVE